MGVDFGGTNTRVALVSQTGRIVDVQHLPSRAVGRPGTFVEALSRSIHALAQTVRLRPAQLRGIGIGAPGPVDVSRGVVYSMVNVPGWHDVPLQRRLQHRLGCPCLVDNDVNVFTLGEWRLGAGRGAEALVGVTLGTGVGGGLVLGGRLYHGCRGGAGELGHMAVNPSGRRCGCGARGCLEAQVGTAAIVSMGRQALRRSRTLRALARGPGGTLTPRLISCAAEQGDASARAIWAEVGRWLGVGLGNVVNLLNPDRLIIGGGVANAWRWFAPSMHVSLRAQAMAVHARSVRIRRAQLGNFAGILGAAVLVWEEIG